MAKAERIADPSLLQDFYITTGLSSLTSKLRLQAKLVLLQPLANADMLEACRVASSRVNYKPNGPTCGSPGYEYLDIQPLSKSWRKELMKIPPIPKLIFDLTLPKEDEKSKGSFTKVYWETAMPPDSLGIVAQDVMTLVITIATAMKMRVNGDVLFEAIYDDTEGVSPRGMARLKKELLALNETKVPRVTAAETAS